MMGMGQLFSGFLPWLVLILPEAIPGLVSVLIEGSSIPDVWPVPIIVMSLYVVLFVTLAIWRFNRKEF